jgi:hypothetical protein
VPISGEQVRQAVDLIARDLHATLGWEFARAEAVALREAQVVAEWDFDEVWPADSYALKVAEEVQQWLHDTFRATTWPACPHHLRHPLWLDTEHLRSVWRCTQNEVDIAPLGSLALLRGEGLCQGS